MLVVCGGSCYVVPRCFPRVKRVRSGDRVYEYLQLVEGRREGGRVRQRVVATLGRVDELKASGQLDRWAGALTRLDPPPVGAHRDVGPLVLVAHYLRRLGLVGVVDAATPMRGRSLLTHGEVVAALVANRLTSPAPLYDVAGWAGAAAVAELLGVPAGLLNDDRLGRALDAFAPVAEDVRGRALLASLERFDVDASRLHLDLTTVRVAGAYPDSALVKKGWGSDRRVARQVRTLQAATPDGVSVYFRPHKGSESELTALGAALETLQSLLPPGLVVVADSAFGHLGTLCAADRKDLRFVVPLRADTGWVERFEADIGSLDALADLDHVAERERRLPPHQRTRWRGRLCPFTVTDPDTGSRHQLRVTYIWSSEEARSVADARERALTKVEEAMGRVRNGLGGRYYKTTKQVQAKVARILHPRVEPLLRVSVGTNDHGKPTLSFQRHRDLKRPRPLRVRPVFLHNDDRIAALVSVIGLALLVFGLIEADLRRRLPAGHRLPGLLPEGRAAKPTGRNILAAFDGLQLTYTPNGPVLDPLTPAQRQVLALLDIPLPWPEQLEN